MGSAHRAAKTENTMLAFYYRFIAWLERAALPYDDDLTVEEYDGDPYP